MTIQQLVLQYETRIIELHLALVQFRWHHALATAVMTVAFLALCVLGIYAIRGQLASIWAALPLVATGAAAWRWRQMSQSKSRLWRLERFYQRGLQRLKGDWAGGGATGEEFAHSNHVYAADLNVSGEGSLFELLCIARTSLGRRGLANYLLDPPALEETLLRQDAVRELRTRTDLRQKVALLGEFDLEESRPETFHEWLESPRLGFARALPVIAAVTSTLLAGIVITGLLGIVPWTSVAWWIAPFVAFHAIVGLVYRKRVNRMTEALRPLSFEMRILRDGLQLLEAEQFQSAKLKQITAQIRNGAASIKKLERLLHALELRNRDPWFYSPSLALLAGTQLCIAVEQWRSKHGAALRTWLQAWSEFEALNCIATYSYENPDHTFPEFAHEEACFEARDLGHPLLPPASCVTNDVELGHESRFYLVSGSNMSGKSTLLRAIGLNAVLAFAGAPVRARALRLSGLSIVASLAAADSLSNGKSKFLAEVERLRQAIEPAIPNRPVLFLVDEIFGGTNSRDRRIAAEAVVRTLVQQGAIGALSTHDLALTEIAGTEDLRGVNVHMGSRSAGDPMDFDYRLKPGVTAETNALAIARLAGVPV